MLRLAMVLSWEAMEVVSQAWVPGSHPKTWSALGSSAHCNVLCT
jgi:hypothetical protein